MTAENPQGNGQSAALRRAWPILLAALIFLATIGFRETLANPDLVDIPIFTTLLTEQGLSRTTLIWSLQIFPLVLAVLAALWIYFGTRQSNFPLWFGLGLVSLYVFQGGVGHGLVDAWGLVGAYLDNLLLDSALLAFLLFPNGRFQPRWSVWVFLVLIMPHLFDPTVIQDARRMLAGGATISGSRLVGVMATISLFAFLAAMQTIRYLRHSTAVERLQTKWVLMGGLFWSTPAVVAIALVVLGPRGRLVGFLLAVTAFGSYVIPIACAVAITKYRLYDLGRVVSRTLTYSAVAGFVALLYVAGVALVRLVFPLSGSLAVAASTLAAVAAISPLHRRVRSAVDRRFNRARYDAQVESAAFSTRLQSALNLDDLVSDIGEVLQKTVQPASTAIWTNAVRSSASEMPLPGEKVDIRPAG
ncbi:MAG TPA: hypothetical protein VJ796_01185 [Acidimicrobiia bacterium]|nr:hypothetical protein [Acidimicrobiia bacterium]